MATAPVVFDGHPVRAPYFLRSFRHSAWLFRSASDAYQWIHRAVTPDYMSQISASEGFMNLFFTIEDGAPSTFKEGVWTPVNTAAVWKLLVKFTGVEGHLTKVVTNLEPQGDTMDLHSYYSSTLRSPLRDASEFQVLPAGMWWLLRAKLNRESNLRLDELKIDSLDKFMAEMQRISPVPDDVSPSMSVPPPFLSLIHI